MAFAESIFAYARQSEVPLFVHLDEIGGLEEHLRALREGVVRTWRLINEAATAGVEAPELLAWTGGAPRLLVYTLRFLHAQPDLATPALVAAMEQALRVLSSIDAVALDVFIREGSPAFE